MAIVIAESLVSMRGNGIPRDGLGINYAEEQIQSGMIGASIMVDYGSAIGAPR